MVGQMTFGKKQFESLDGSIRPLLPPLYDAMGAAVAMIDKDTDAFTQYMVSACPPCNISSFVSTFRLIEYRREI